MSPQLQLWGLESEVSSHLSQGVLEAMMSQFPSEMYKSNEGKGDGR